jgi:hypothetical protein
MVLNGIDWGNAPYLRGYVSTKAKPGSETLLTSDYGEPILAIWRVGLGKAAAFTSDVKNRWAVEWLRWPGYTQFWSQLVRALMRHRIQQSFDLSAQTARGQVHVMLDAVDASDQFINAIESSLDVFDPKRPESKRTFPLAHVAPGRYTADFRLQDPGAFLLRARHQIDGKVVSESVAAISVPYPEEFVALVPNPSLLERAAVISGGRVRPGAAQVFAPGAESIRFHKEIWSFALFALLGLFVVDVLLRRVRILRPPPLG